MEGGETDQKATANRFKAAEGGNMEKAEANRILDRLEEIYIYERLG